MKAGVLAFFTKPFREQDMLDAVAQALARDADRLATEQSVVSLHHSYSSLTERELQMMALVVDGLMNKQIASKTKLRKITVKVHSGQAMKKIGARSVAELVRKAEALGETPKLY